jgi:dTDP-4-amino-4,6-dideoxygalactose transaminase
MTKFDKPIYVTMPTLAPLQEVDAYMEKIWASGVMTHNGPLVQQFERDFSAWSGFEKTVAVCNGTLAIQLAIRALDLPKGGEIITTPFTFIATISSILYEGYKPVFVDIDPETLNIDSSKIEAAINDKTVAILPVHVFGNPCDVEAIDAIAAKHGLKVIYDAAHAVGVKVNGSSIFTFGDVSATSFHATKLLNTSEGGGIFAKNPEVDERLRELRFFGYNAEKDVVCVGTNAKMTEVNAAIGLSNLKYMDAIITDRRAKYSLYKQILSGISGIGFQKIDESCNCSYFPIILSSETLLEKVDSALKANNIFARRYFWPSVNTYRTICPDAEACPISEDIANRILCLPLYYTLPMDTIKGIAENVVEIAR